ncbi:MAG TPA: hypothetical protein VHG89_08100 [Verrucomicrobiae bacterium]|nr:hypothetical protein [Verrucomicrobiae bacterium]
METNLKPQNSEVHERLQQVRDALLHLHKALVDSERENYEKTMGKIPSPNQFLKLLIEDPWFAWLHPLSQLVVSMDEALDEKEPLTAAVADALVKEAANLLVATENGDGFSTHYFDALQRDPDVIFAHASAAKLLNPKKASV